MEIKCKGWRIEKGEVTGEYSVNMGKKEIASNNFNGEYSGEKISFSSEILDKARELDSLICEAIINNFKGV
jgi:hypothetical protein